MAEPTPARDFKVLHGVEPPERQIASIRTLIIESTSMLRGVDDVERMRRAELIARAVYERGGLSLQEVQNVWTYCQQNGRDPSALFAWKLHRLLGGWPWL